MSRSFEKNGQSKAGKRGECAIQQEFQKRYKKMTQREDEPDLLVVETVPDLTGFVPPQTERTNSHCSGESFWKEEEKLADAKEEIDEVID